MRGKGTLTLIGILVIAGLLAITVQASPRSTGLRRVSPGHVAPTEPLAKGAPIWVSAESQAAPLPAAAERRSISPDAQDGQASKIVPALETTLAATPAAQALPVLVTGALPEQVKASLGSASVTRVFQRALTGFAARLTPAQIRALAAEPGIASLVPDVPVYALLDGATTAIGSTKVNRELRVTGDRDGDPRQYSRRDVVIAVVDTGIDAQHQDLAGKVIGWYDAVDGQSGPYDDHGHGTHVAGIAAGAGRANRAMKGVAPGAALVGVKVLAGDGSGTLAGVIDGIEWVIAQKDVYGIKVMNLSLGAAIPTDGRDPLSLAVNAAAEAGIVAVVAAGNNGPMPYTVGTPAAAEKAVTVCAMADPAEGGWAIASFSSRGPTLDGRIKPDLCAPGYQISAPQAGTAGQYVSYSGTSMATPVVAGTAALLLAINPTLTPDRAKAILAGTAQDWGAPGKDAEFGWGRLDTWAAIRRAAGARNPDPLPGPNHQAVVGELTEGEEVWYELTVATANQPLALTLLHLDAATRFYDLDLFLYDEAGQLIAQSATRRRQETILYRPLRPGRYRIRVQADEGEGRFSLDASFS
jgi:serine protease AprX